MKTASFRQKLPTEFLIQAHRSPNQIGTPSPGPGHGQMPNLIPSNQLNQDAQKQVTDIVVSLKFH